MATTNKFIKKYWAWVVVIVFLVALFFYSNSKPDAMSLRIKGVTINVELAQTPEARERGLSGRDKLADDGGLLFIFEEPGEYKFWMKDMNFPIDMIWISENLQIVYIKKDARPELYPEVYGPGQDAKYVLEVNSGFSDKYNLQEGDEFEFFHILK